MASTTSSRCAALLLLSLFHLSSCWDASSIWFPDTNNPVFYNMTFYQQASQSIDTEPPSENLLPATEPPRKNNRPRPVEQAPVKPAEFEQQRPRPTSRPRPNVFNPVQQAPVRPTDFEAQRPRPNVFNPVEQTPPRSEFEAQRPRPNVFNPVQQAPVRPTDFEAQRPRPNVFNQVQQAPVRPLNLEAERPRPNVFRPMNQAPIRPTDFEAQRPDVFNPTPVRPTDTYASVVGRRTTTTTTTKPLNLNRQPSKNTPRGQQGVKGDPQSGNRRITEQQKQQQQQQFNRNQQNRQPIRNPEPTPDILVGYKTLPYTEATPTNRRDQQPSRNRLRRTQVEGGGDGRNYFNNDEHERAPRQYPEPQSWAGNTDAFLSGSRPEERLETTNNGIGGERNFGRTVVPVERNWNTDTTNSDRQNPVEENVISELETSSRATGPSRCVWAIISCCKPTSSEIRYMCFEALGCHGAFWDTNPCSRDMTLAAVQATGNFYNVPRTEEQEED